MVSLLSMGLRLPNIRHIKSRLGSHCVGKHVCKIVYVKGCGIQATFNLQNGR